MEFFSLSELGDPNIFQTEETKYVVVNMEDSEESDSDDIVDCGGCETEPGLHGTNEGLFYNLANFSFLD